jgi:hypothetical protein
MVSDANTIAPNAKLSLCHGHQEFKVFHHIPCIVSGLLHTMQINILDHLQEWIVHFMKTHGWLAKYNAIWLSVPA